MGPIAARLVDRQGRRFREVFDGLQQPTIQTLVVQIGTDPLLSHPLDRLCAGLHYRLHVRIPATPRLSHAVRLSSAVPTVALRNLGARVQHFPWERQTISENRQRCVQ